MNKITFPIFRKAAANSRFASEATCIALWEASTGGNWFETPDGFDFDNIKHLPLFVFWADCHDDGGDGV